MYDALKDLLEPLDLFGAAPPGDAAPPTLAAAPANTTDAALEKLVGATWSLHLAVLTFAICHALHFAGTWRLLTGPTRDLLAAYNMLLAVVTATCLLYTSPSPRD